MTGDNSEYFGESEDKPKEVSVEITRQLADELMECVSSEDYTGTESYLDSVNEYGPGMMSKVLQVLNWKESALLFRCLNVIAGFHKSAKATADGVLEILTEQTIPDKLDEEGLQNITVKGIGRWQVSGQAHCSVKEGHKDGLYEWMRETNNESLITETINPSTLKAFVLEQKKKGNQTPDEHLNLHFYSKASLVK